MEEQKERIQYIKQELIQLELQKEKFQNELKNECLLYQKLCGKETGHDYVPKSDYEFHSSKTYHVCKMCGIHK